MQKGLKYLLCGIYFQTERWIDMSRMSKKRKQENIFDFTLTDDEIAEITNLDKCTGYYNRADEQLVAFANRQPTYEKSFILL